MLFWLLFNFNWLVNRFIWFFLSLIFFLGCKFCGVLFRVIWLVVVKLRKGKFCIWIFFVNIKFKLLNVKFCWEEVLEFKVGRVCFMEILLLFRVNWFFIWGAIVVLVICINFFKVFWYKLGIFIVKLFKFSCKFWFILGKVFCRGRLFIIVNFLLLICLVKLVIWSVFKFVVIWVLIWVKGLFGNIWVAIVLLWMVIFFSFWSWYRVCL